MSYKIEYSPTDRAGCRGKPPCYGTKILKGELRLGVETSNPFSGEGGHLITQWRHWGCVTPHILKTIKKTGGSRNIQGFARLSIEDQHKITAAVQRGSVDRMDVSPTRSFDYGVLQSLATAGPSSQNSAVPNEANHKRKRSEFLSSQLSAASLNSERDIQEFTDSEGVSENITKKRKIRDNTLIVRSGENLVDTQTTGVNAMSATALDSEAGDSEASDNEEDEVLVYARYSTKVVGIKYYTGLVGYGEQVSLVREPTNAYDRNAIRVMNISGHQVGHIPATDASKFAPLLDKKMITLEGTMTSSNLTGKSQWFLGIEIAIIGPSDPTRRQILEPLLLWATPNGRGFTAAISQTGVVGTSVSPKKSRPLKVNAKEAAKATQLRAIMDGMAHLDDSARRTSVINSLCDHDVFDLPVHPSPPSRDSGLLHTDLLKHQKQALSWCIDAENPKLPRKESEKPIQFWELQSSQNKSYYYNVATKTPQRAPPVLGRGGIIGDDMGLGKTLTILSLILATREERVAQGHSGATLIVAPLSVLSNWSTQIGEHVTAEAVCKVHVYYGEGRDAKASFLRQQDIVLTTYQMLAADFSEVKTTANPDDIGTPQVKAIKMGLFAVKWKRVVLDEGHTIRNPKTKTAQACYALDAERRWVVSGTPIINSPSDIGSLLRFLRICSPLDNPDYFRRLLTRPLSRHEPEAADLLKALMSSCCLRRTKEMQDRDGKSLVPLPPVVINVVNVQLDEETRKMYDAVEKESRSLVQTVYTQGSSTNQISYGINVLSILTRLRQIALDRHLVPASYLENLRDASKVHQGHDRQQPPADISDEEKAHLQNILEQAINDSLECAICLDTMAEPRITVCRHIFCLDCITEVINRQRICPMDRSPLAIEGLIEPRPLKEDDCSEEVDNRSEIKEADEPPSAKIVRLIELLRVQPSDSKSLVFSQFTSFLDKIAIALKKAGIPFVHFDGKMSAKKRKEALDAFSEPLPLANGREDEQMQAKHDNEGQEDKWKEKKGKGKSKAKVQATSRFLKHGATPIPVVMLISLKSGALGLNCTVANNVFLMDPWWQEAIESQAIDRVNRLGQKKGVFVYQMVAEDTIEAKVLRIQERKKNLITQAFSSTKAKVTQHQRKEARLQELVQLFAQN